MPEDIRPAGVIALPYGVTFELWPAIAYVCTVFASGARAGATREDTDRSREIAGELGYRKDPDGLWQSLVDHELLHSLMASWVLAQPSPTLLEAAGAMRCPYDLHVYEEAIALGMQRYLMRGEVSKALEPFAGSLPTWRRQFAMAVGAVPVASLQRRGG